MKYCCEYEHGLNLLTWKKWPENGNKTVPVARECRLNRVLQKYQRYSRIIGSYNVLKFRLTIFEWFNSLFSSCLVILNMWLIFNIFEMKYSLLSRTNLEKSSECILYTISSILLWVDNNNGSTAVSINKVKSYKTIRHK